MGEAVEFGEVVGGDVGIVDEFGEHATGVDGAELLVVADEHGSPLVRVGELVVGEESGGVDHAGFVDHHHGPGREPVGGSGAVGSVVFVEEFVDRVGSDAGTVGEFVRGAGGRCESVDVDAGRAPGVRRGAQHAGLARPGRSDDGRHVRRLLGQRCDGGGLSGVEPVELVGSAATRRCPVGSGRWWPSRRWLVPVASWVRVV